MSGPFFELASAGGETVLAFPRRAVEEPHGPKDAVSIARSLAGSTGSGKPFLPQHSASRCTVARAPAGLCRPPERPAGRGGNTRSMTRGKVPLGRGPQEHRGGVLGHPRSPATPPLTLASPSSSPP